MTQPYEIQPLDQATAARREIIERLRIRRIELGLTQKQIADKIGTTQPAISAIEKQISSNPHYDTLRRYAQAVGLELIQVEAGHDLQAEVTWLHAENMRLSRDVLDLSDRLARQGTYGQALDDLRERAQHMSDIGSTDLALQLWQTAEELDARFKDKRG